MIEGQEQKIGMMPLVFQCIGLLLFGYLSFMGLNYLTNGNLVISGAVTLVGMVICYVISYLLSHRKSKKTNLFTYRINKKSERVLLAVYAGLFLVYSAINIHCLIIDFLRKSDLQKAGTDKVQDIRNLKKDYETAILNKQNDLKTQCDGWKNSFEGGVSSSYDSLESLLGKGTVGKIAGIKIEPGSYQRALIEKTGSIYSKYQLDPTYLRETDLYLNNSQSVFEDWKLFQTAYTFRELDGKAAEYLAKAKQKMPGFVRSPLPSSPLSFSDVSLNLRSSGISTLLCFLFCVLIHCCILAPYVVSDRKAPPPKT